LLLQDCSLKFIHADSPDQIAKPLSPVPLQPVEVHAALNDPHALLFIHEVCDLLAQPWMSPHHSSGKDGVAFLFRLPGIHGAAMQAIPAKDAATWIEHRLFVPHGQRFFLCEPQKMATEGIILLANTFVMEIQNEQD